MGAVCQDVLYRLQKLAKQPSALRVINHAVFSVIFYSNNFILIFVRTLLTPNKDKFTVLVTR